MIESYKEALESFKRVDHLYHVSLKYTRTVDVIRSVVERIISTYEHSVASLLRCMKEEKIIEDIPDNPVGKALLVQEKCGSVEEVKALDLYLTLRKLMRMPYSGREEFRRHVTMIVQKEGEEILIDIDLLYEYYLLTAHFLSYVKTRVEPYKDRE